MRKIDGLSAVTLTQLRRGFSQVGALVKRAGAVVVTERGRPAFVVCDERRERASAKGDNAERCRFGTGGRGRRVA
jgi:prevent-host-death family protein